MAARIRYLLTLLGVAIASTPAFADDWPMFGRDQTRNAVSPEKGAPTFWQVENKDEGIPNKNILWKSLIGNGRSYSGSLGDPVVVNGQIWIGSNTHKPKNGHHYSFACLEEKTGKLLYQYEVPWLDVAAERFLHTMGSSPLIDGDRMWFFNNRWEMVCLDIGPLRKGAGNPREVWNVDTRTELGVHRTKSIFDCRVCSVAAHQDWVYLITGNGVNWHDEGKVNADAPSLVCFDKNTGKVVWKDNSPGANILHGQFASPTVITIDGKTQVIAPQGDGWVRSFDAATGKLLWKFDTNPPDAKWDRSGRGTRNYLPATAVFHDGRIYIGNGQEPEKRTGVAWLYCIDPTRSGDISPHLPDGPGKGKPNPNSGMVWKYGGVDEKTKRRIFDRTLSNVAIHDGLLIAVDIGGIVHCLDAQTGKRHWIHDCRSDIWNCPLIADGKVYVAAEDYNIRIFALSKKKSIINTIEMPPRLRTTPVFANGVLYIASGHWLYAIAEPKK